MCARRIPIPSRKPTGAVKRQSLSFRPVALDFHGGCNVLSIQPSNSVLSEKALNALKYAFLMNKKVGIGCLPSPDLSPNVEELEKAVASYEIARKLVEWFDQYTLESDHDSNDLNLTQVKPEPCREEEHRSALDLKNNTLDLENNSDRMFSLLQHDDHRCRDLKSLPLQTCAGEVKDLKIDSKSIDFQSKLFSNYSPDLKFPSDDPFVADVLISRTTECEGLDFFGAPTLDDLCEMRNLSDGAFGSVDIDFAFGFDRRQDKRRSCNDSDNCEDNLESPLSSPGSPCSPYSPSDILQC